MIIQILQHQIIKMYYYIIKQLLTTNHRLKVEINDLKKKIDVLLWKYLRPFKFSTIPQVSKIKESEDCLGIYTLENQIGKGGFGTVRLGRITETGQKVAVKQLSKDRLCDVEDIEAVEAEIKLMTMLTVLYYLLLASKYYQISQC